MIDSSNRFLVQQMYAGTIRIADAPPSYRELSREEAVNLAAWLLALADPDLELFRHMLHVIQES